MKLENILKRTFGIKPEEKVLVITDRRQIKIGKKFFNASKKLSKNTKMLIRPIAKNTAEEPPKYIADEMLNSDVILIFASVSSMSHTKARRKASKKGARIATGSDFEEKMFKSLEANPYKMSREGKKIIRVLKKTKNVKIITKSGTNITFSVKNRLIDLDEGLYNKPGNKGNFGNLPAGEVCLAPVEGTSNGVIVIDSLKDLDIVFAKPGTTVLVRKGKAVDISDKRCKLANIFKKIKNSTNIAEFGIGINYKAKIIGNILQDEKVKGTCHIAFGNNKSFGGKVNSKIHIDAILFKPTIWFDKKMIMKKGKLLI